MVLCSFFRIFCPVSRFFKHAKFSKVNAKFSKGVDFWKPEGRKFCQNLRNLLSISHLANPLKTRLFSAKTLLVENNRVLARVECSFLPQNRPKINILSKLAMVLAATNPHNQKMKEIYIINIIFSCTGCTAWRYSRFILASRWWQATIGRAHGHSRKKNIHVVHLVSLRQPHCSLFFFHVSSSFSFNPLAVPLFFVFFATRTQL